MSYVRDNLLPNERILVEARIHPAIYIPSAVWAVVTITFLLIGLAPLRVAGSNTSATPFWALCLTAVFFILTLREGLRAFLIIATTEFAVTDKRVIAKRGFIRRRTLEMLLSKIESVGVGQSMLGRWLDFGTVTVIGTGGTREIFTAITAPLALRTRINQILEDSAAPST